MSSQHNRNSPHLSNHLQNGSNPPSPSMSNAQQQQQQQGGQSRQQPVNYPSPTSYPSPSLSSAQYNYPPPNNQQNEPYRASPTGSNGSMPLPSMRSLDPLQQQQVQHHMGSPLPPPVAQMGAPYYHSQNQTLPHPGMQYPNVTSDPNGQMRYALPVTDNRVMSGGRHKKEIKRRTKTGCLTCRKRRIKCDEAHPACRNCQKSKRECLGYDPIFKNNPGPAAIQPAPSSAPSQGSSTITSGVNPYGNQPQMTGYPHTTNMPPYDPALSTGISSPGSTPQQYDYTSAIDPALEAAAPSTTAAANANQYQQPTPAKRTTVAALLAVGGALPAPLPENSDVAQSPAVIEEVKHLYYSIYAPGLESFLESKWFSVKGGSQLLIDKPVLEQFAVLLQQFAKAAQNDLKEMAYTSSVEARTIWALASMVKSGATAAVKPESKPAVPPTDDPVEAALRLDVFETLLTGEVAPGNALTRPGQVDNDQIRSREVDFWYTLADFVAIDYESASSTKQVDDTLGMLRNLLDGRENRDVLYSIAVVRAIGHRVSEYAESDKPIHLDESDNRSKLSVAKKFVMDEANGNGTTNTIRRFCELAGRTWGHH